MSLISRGLISTSTCASTFSLLIRASIGVCGNAFINIVADTQSCVKRLNSMFARPFVLFRYSFFSLFPSLLSISILFYFINSYHYHFLFFADFLALFSADSLTLLSIQSVSQIFFPFLTFVRLSFTILPVWLTPIVAKYPVMRRLVSR